MRHEPYLFQSGSYYHNMRQLTHVPVSLVYIFNTKATVIHDVS